MVRHTGINDSLRNSGLSNDICGCSVKMQVVLLMHIFIHSTALLSGWFIWFELLLHW